MFGFVLNIDDYADQTGATPAAVLEESGKKGGGMVELSEMNDVIAELEQWLRVQITIKDQAGVLVNQDIKALFPGRDSHHNWHCVWHRSTKSEWRKNCFEYCNGAIHERARSERKSFVSACCWKGLAEVVVPVFEYNTLTFIMYAGVFRAQSEPDLSAMPAEYRRRYRELPVMTDQTAHRVMRLLEVVGNGVLRLGERRDQNFSGKKGAVLRFIRENFHRPIKLEDIATELHLSPSRASHCIKEETGSSFSDLLIEERVRRVGNLLISTGLSLAEIATKTGFSNEFYLSRQFSKRMGCPPQKFRTRQFRADA